MSEYLRHDFADYQGSASSATTVLPATPNKDGILGIDVRHFGAILIHVTGTFVASFSYQFSNDDGATWNNSIGVYVTSGSTVNASSSSSTGFHMVPVVGKLFRLLVTSYTSGTVIAKAMLTSNAPAYGAMGVQAVNLTPAATIGASSNFHLISAATTNSTSVKATNGVVNMLTVSNNGAAVAYLKMYDKASAPTVGTDTPIATIMVPVGGTVVIPGSVGWRFTTGIGFGITTGMAVADTGAVAAAQVSVAINYT